MSQLQTNTRPVQSRTPDTTRTSEWTMVTEGVSPITILKKIKPTHVPVLALPQAPVLALPQAPVLALPQAPILAPQAPVLVPPQVINVYDPLEELLNEIRDLKVSHQYQIDQLKLVIEAQSRMIKEIRILRFDQEAMIQSMVIEGKKIAPYVEPDKRDMTSLMFPSNSFSFQRNLNWGIRSGKPTPFIAEHSSQKPGAQ